MIKANYFSGWRGDHLAAIGGALVPLAFAPFDAGVLVFVGLALVMCAWFFAPPGRAFWRGWLFGVAMFGVGVSWVHVSMHRFGGVSIPLSLFLTAMFVFFLALFPAIVGYLSRKLFPASSKNAIFVFGLLMPVLWVLVEWTRGWIFTGFPWLNLGYSQIDLPLSGYAPLWGVYSVTFSVVLSVGLALAGAVSDAKNRLRYVLPALLVLWIAPWGFKQLDWSDSVDQPFQVSLIQGNIEQDQKWQRDKMLPTLELYANLSRENWKSALIVWPETAVPAFYHQVKPYLQAIAQEARMNGSELLVGIPVYDPKKEIYFNTMTSLGAQEGFYEKRHLVPFGEYLPLQSLLQGLIDFFNIPMSNFASGKDDEPPVLEVAGQKAGISICYEDAFGEEVMLALPSATFLVNASNDAWFGDSMAPHQHLEIARMRSLETGRYMLRATNTGVSAIIDDKGRIKSKAPQFETFVLTDTIQPKTGLTPYAVFGNLSVIAFMFVLLVVAYILNRRELKSA